MMSGSATAEVTRLAGATLLLVVCEFDGAIAEFVTDPVTARPIDGAMDALAMLASLPRTRAAVISGRSLASLSAVCTTGSDASRFGIELIGSDGMEIESRLTLGLTADARRTQRRLLRAAGQIADAHPGVTVDEKPYGVALHLRGATATDAEHAIERLLDVAQSMPQRVYSQSRSDVLDLSLLPVGQDWAIDALRQRGDATVFYAGNDDRAFASLATTDVGCKVGAECTEASLCVGRPADLVRLLAQLCRERPTALGAR
jgi:trehalose 6-phosphate phosphatase